MPVMGPVRLVIPDDLPDRPEFKLKATPAVNPATDAQCVEALERMTSEGGAPRWAVVGWAVDIVGPGRSVTRAGDPGGGSLDLMSVLVELLVRLDPTPSVTVLPQWLHGRQDTDALTSYSISG